MKGLQDQVVMLQKEEAYNNEMLRKEEAYNNLQIRSEVELRLLDFLTSTASKELRSGVAEELRRQYGSLE